MNQEFEQKIIARIREQIGDLITDEELKTLVEKAVHLAFFEPRKIPSSGYNYNNRTEDAPSFFVEEIQKLMREQMNVLLKEWLSENSEEVNKTISSTIEKGVYGMMQSYFESKMQQPLWDLQSKLANSGLLK